MLGLEALTCMRYSSISWLLWYRNSNVQVGVGKKKGRRRRKSDVIAVVIPVRGKNRVRTY